MSQFRCQIGHGQCRYQAVLSRHTGTSRLGLVSWPTGSHSRQHCRTHAAADADDKPGSSGRPSSGDLGFKAFVSEAEWRKIDKKVNKYPGQRTFTAIGTGGDDFKAAMLSAVWLVVGTVHQECVSERPSSGGKYISVRIGPVWVESADQVVEVFRNMREDSRLKWYM
eukprot:GHRR01010320.1.p1 GENE.GHRR01010320.1~~GHRR01010320.1.p1  ORF type:complete len:167 (+),score=33.02 GHRR01010320.1:240-740(+)